MSSKKTLKIHTDNELAVNINEHGGRAYIKKE